MSILLYVSLITTLFILFRKATRRKAIFPVLAGACLIIWPWAVEKNELDVIFLDVGQGDGAIVRVPTESGIKTILVDAGFKDWTRDMGEEVVVPVLKNLGVNEIDLLIMSHPHSDHIGGVEILLEQFEVNEIWDSHGSYGSHLYGRILKSAEEKEVKYSRLQTGYIDTTFAPLRLILFHPDSAYSVNETNVNNSSLVVKMSYGKSDFLFVGDLEEEGDEVVLPFGELLQSEVLKVGHHGSITSSTQPFLDVVDPDIAIVSVGKRNKFRHPSEVVMERLERSDAEILRTDFEGAIWLKSDGHIIRRYDWR